MTPSNSGLLAFSCHVCGIELEVPSELGGETAPCPGCGAMITAPIAPIESAPLDLPAVAGPMDPMGQGLSGPASPETPGMPPAATPEFLDPGMVAQGVPAGVTSGLQMETSVPLPADAVPPTQPEPVPAAQPGVGLPIGGAAASPEYPDHVAMPQGEALNLYPGRQPEQGPVMQPEQMPVMQPEQGPVMQPEQMPVMQPEIPNSHAEAPADFLDPVGPPLDPAQAAPVSDDEWEAAPDVLAGSDSLPQVTGFGQVIIPPSMEAESPAGGGAPATYAEAPAYAETPTYAGVPTYAEGGVVPNPTSNLASPYGANPLPTQGVSIPPTFVQSERKRRKPLFGVTIAVLSMAILSLSGVLVWRSEVWRPDLAGIWNEESDRSNRWDADRIPASSGPDRTPGTRGGMADPALASVPGPARPQEAVRASEKGSPEEAIPKVEENLAAVERAAKPALPQASPPPSDPTLVVDHSETPAPMPAVEEPSKAESVAPPTQQGGQEPVMAMVENRNPEPPSEDKGPAESPSVTPVRGAEPEPAEPQVVEVAEKAGGQGEGLAQTGSGLERARATVRKFLEAESWAERVPFIFDGDQKQAALRDYFQEHADRALSDYRLDFFHSESGEGNKPSMYVFFLTMQHEQDGFPVIVKSLGEKQFGVDWDLFIEFKDRHFADFVEEKVEESREYRVVIQRVTYWEEDRDKIPDIENLVCYKIDPPYPGYTNYAFVPKDSDTGKKMVGSLSWETDPLAARVRLNWTKFPDGRPYLTVTELVSRSWVD